MRNTTLIWLIAILATASVRAADEAQDDPFVGVRDAYGAEAQPLVKQFCLDCHSTDAQEGELDLERFARFEDVRRGTKAWLKVAEMLDNGEMPPEDAEQPSAEERKSLRDWVGRYLDAEARASAGDPGPVVLRRLNNAQYTYTIQDLTGVALQPAREFPTDGAAGEGFTNAGGALAMSPALLTKYFAAGKQIARHAVLLPDGFRFSEATTRRDWTNEILAQIRQIYLDHTGSDGSTQVQLQGLSWKTNQGGRLPLKKYLSALLAERESLTAGNKTIAGVAAEQKLNAKYLASLWKLLNEKDGSLLLEGVRARWREAKSGDVAGLVDYITPWQEKLTRFQSVGHMKPWMVAVDPVTSRQEIRVKIPTPGEGNQVTLYLAAGEAGDGAEHDAVVWQRPRLVTPGRPDLLLRDVRRVASHLAARRQHLFASAAKALVAADEASRASGEVDVAELARKHDVDADELAEWLDYLGIHSSGKIKLDHFTGHIDQSAGYDFVKGWGSPKTPSLVANSSDQHVRIPGNMKPHGVVVHPSPKLYAAVGWQSPLAGTVHIEGKVADAHPECGNGVAWLLELRRGRTRQVLGSGTATGSAPATLGPIDALAVRPGDLVSLLIGPRDGNHGCDLTDIELVLSTSGDESRKWNLTHDVSGDVLAGNPHADSYGNQGVWHFFSEPVSATGATTTIPAGSLLARWQAADSADERHKLADEVQRLLTGGPPADAKHPDAVLYRQLASLGGPLFARARDAAQASSAPASGGESASAEEKWGLDPAMFGRHPDGTQIDLESLCVAAPSVIEVHLPADLVVGSELVTTGVLDPRTGTEGSVQLSAGTSKPSSLTELRNDAPVLVGEDSAARNRFERAFADFRSWFPRALCYAQIVPVDEVITLTLFHREDEPLCRLMLDDDERARLDRLWTELHFVSGDALTTVDAFAQLLEYASQDSDPALFEPFRKPINERAAAYRQALLDAEPPQLDALIDFAARAYRRPLSDVETRELRSLYQKLRDEELPHDEAFRFTLARVFIAPEFLYRLEKAAPGEKPGPVSDWELASRLSYFLWSSMPDTQLREAAAAGKLHEPDVLVHQARRMLGDDRVRRLAREFACQWLHIYEFDTLDEKSERHFPEFRELRGDMYEEAIRFFTDLFQHDGSVLSILDANHTFVNQRLAAFYDIPGVSGPEWRRVDGVGKYARGGILGLAATLAKQSGASRTSPTLRGNWVSEVLLGEKLPRPPKDVPQLPDDETAIKDLTVRQLVEKHSSDPRCAGCHVRVDPMGFALEAFDAIGRHREKDLAERPIDAHTQLADGTEFDGLTGLRDYLLEARREAVLRQFCRKLLGYALGRGVQLSDEPLLAEMHEQLQANEFRFSAAVEAIVRSPQFREIRGKDAQFADAP